MNKRITVLHLGSILVICGMAAAGLLTSPSSEVVFASIEGETTGSNPNQEAADHINEAKTALQNGDSEGAQKHLDLAHQALGCSPWDPRCASE